MVDKDRIICYIYNMRCNICQNEFIPNKYRPHQEVCSQPECQKIRQVQNEREWRLKNPDYFKCFEHESAWRKNRQRYNALWKSTHKSSLKNYEESHREQRREYMREYMRRYRQKQATLADTKVSFIGLTIACLFSILLV